MEKLITNKSEYALDLSDFTEFFQALHVKIIEEKMHVTPGNIKKEFLELIDDYKEDEQLKISNKSFKELIKSINITDEVKKDFDKTLKLIEEIMLENRCNTICEKDDNTDYLDLIKSINILRSISKKDETVIFEDLMHCHYITSNQLFKSIIGTQEKKEVTKRI